MAKYFLHSTWPEGSWNNHTKTRLTEGTDGTVAALPFAEEGSRRPAAAAALKCGWRKDLSSTRRSRVSSSERRWCCSHSRTSTCSLTDRDGLEDAGKKNKKTTDVCKLKPLPGLRCDSPSPHSWFLFCNVFHMVLSHRYSINKSRPASPAVNATQILSLTSIHANLHHWAHFSGPFQSWLLPTYSPPYAVLSLNSTHLPLWKHSHPQNTFLWCWK